MSPFRSRPLPVVLAGALLVTGLGAGAATPAGAAPAGPAATSVGAVRASPAAASRAAVHSVTARKKKRRPAAAVGTPPGRYVVPQGSYFSFPNKSAAKQQAIRSKVVATIASTWGAPHDPYTGAASPIAGTIRIATWSFEDWRVARALVAAKKRGVSVQVVAAAGKNRFSRPWRYLRKNLKARLYPVGRPDLAERSSFARICRGACRGAGGTAHAKYFLFDNVGPTGARGIVVNTSMNLTQFAYTNQWNQAQVWHSTSIYWDYLNIFRQARATTRSSYHAASFGGFASDYFFPAQSSDPTVDPVMALLGPVGCTGATSGGAPGGRTRIRVNQYAIYGQRGIWIAKRLRQLWVAGCDVRIIYSFASRPVMSVLRSHRVRGPIPMRQSVIRDGSGAFETYNHSKWMTITGRWGGSAGVWMAFSGSANWADLALTSDEQMQSMWGYALAGPYLANFDETWRQRTSRKPRGRSARSFDGARLPPELLTGGPELGKGKYRFMDED